MSSPSPPRPARPELALAPAPPPPSSRADDRGRPRGDLELVRSTLAGEPGCVDLLVRRLECVPRILAAKNARLGAPMTDDELCDVTQDVLATLWRKLPDYRGQAAFESWVYPFCVLVLMNAARRKQRARRFAQASAPPVPEPEADPALVPDYEPLYRGIARLPVRQSTVIRLRYFQQLSFEEIARRLALPVGTAKTNYYRGMERLRRALGPLLGGERP